MHEAQEWSAYIAQVNAIETAKALAEKRAEEAAKGGGAE